MYEIYKIERRRLLENSLSCLRPLGYIRDRKHDQREMAALRNAWASIRLSQ